MQQQQQAFINQSALQQINQPLLFLKQNQKITIDSIQRIQFVVKRNEQNDSFGVCSVCLESWDTLVVQERKQLAMTNCRHVFCLSELILALDNGGKCPYCRQSVKQYFILDTKLNNDGTVAGQQDRSIILFLSAIKRFDLTYFLQSVCSQQGCALKSIVQCNFCLAPNSCLCRNHSDTLVGGYIDKHYHRSIFYCKCQIDFNDFSLQNSQPTFLQQLLILRNINPVAYSHQVQQALLQMHVQQHVQWNVFLCPFCLDFSANAKSKLERHLIQCHFGYYQIINPGAIQCEDCRRKYKKNLTYMRHLKKCIQGKAPEDFDA